MSRLEAALERAISDLRSAGVALVGGADLSLARAGVGPIVERGYRGRDFADHLERLVA